jgi:hypothetical protein
MGRIFLGTGNFTWNSVERRSDRYGSVRLVNDHIPEDNPEHNILIDPELDRLEGKFGILFAEVVEPIESQHIGDIFRGFSPSLPKLGEIVVLGEGELFIEHNGKIHEKSEFEKTDEKSMQTVMQAFAKLGIKCGNVDENMDLPPSKVYDLIGLKPNDGRKKDWLNPKSFYRLHQSKVNLYFQEKQNAAS